MQPETLLVEMVVVVVTTVVVTGDVVVVVELLVVLVEEGEVEKEGLVPNPLQAVTLLCKVVLFHQVGPQNT